MYYTSKRIIHIMVYNVFMHEIKHVGIEHRVLAGSDGREYWVMMGFLAK